MPSNINTYYMQYRRKLSIHVQVYITCMHMYITCMCMYMYTHLHSCRHIGWRLPLVRWPRCSSPWTQTPCSWPASGGTYPQAPYLHTVQCSHCCPKRCICVCVCEREREREGEREREREWESESGCAWLVGGSFVHLSLWFVFPMFLCPVWKCSGPCDNPVSVARSNNPLGYTHRHI